MHWSAQYIGIPYLENGYTRDGASCWGLVRLVLMEQFGVFLPRHDEAPVENRPYEVAARYRHIPFDEVREGDVYHLWGVRNGVKVPTHAGIAVGPSLMLHTEAGTGSIIERTNSKRAAWRLIDAYRPELNADA